MKYRQAQISMEYIIIIGFVIVAILVPSFIILFGSTTKTVQGSVNLQKITDLGNGLINDAKQMYYLGLYSKKISTYDVIDNTQNIFIVDISYAGKEYSYIGVTINEGKGPVTYTFLSDIPLTSDDSTTSTVINNKLIPLIKECSEPGYVCTFYLFLEPTKAGRKNFKIETVLKNNIVRSSIIYSPTG